MIAAGRLSPTDVLAVLFVAGPVFVAGSVFGSLGFTPLFFAMGWLLNLAPAFGDAFHAQSGSGGPVGVLSDFRDMARLFTGRPSAIPAAERGLAAITFTSVLVLLYEVVAGSVGVALWFWGLAPRDPDATGLAAEGALVVHAVGQATVVMAALFALLTLVGLVRSSAERIRRDRAIITFCYVVVDVLWFTLLYQAGSVGELTVFAVAPESAAAPLRSRVPQSLLLALGTLTTAGAPSITPINDWARLAMALELLTLAVVASWFIGLTQAVRALGSRSSTDAAKSSGS
jgi:hypothetical protein